MLHAFQRATLKSRVGPGDEATIRPLFSITPKETYSVTCMMCT